ncbi:MAG: hypothetical protein KAS67_07405 [Thermoplasmata archaeon]|nr:hypothetical protein [Thermoplasmata archaeon]
MDFNLWVFVTIFMLTFALFLVLVGIFTTYFGSGKSRKIGAGLMIGGLVLGILWVLMTSTLYFDETMIDMGTNVYLEQVILDAIVTIIAAGIGAGAALGIFLLSIMKS